MVLLYNQHLNLLMVVRYKSFANRNLSIYNND